MRVRCAVVHGVALVALVGLAGCSPAGDRESGPPVGEPFTAGPLETVEDRPETAAFVAAFRSTYPALADGRSDEAIAADVTQVCDDLRDPATGQSEAEGEAAALRRIPGRFERDGITADWTTSRTILALAKGTACGPVRVIPG